MAGFLFRLETTEGVPAVPNWRSGDTICLGRRTLRVVGRRDDEADRPPVLIVENAAEGDAA